MVWTILLEITHKTPRPSRKQRPIFFCKLIWSFQTIIMGIRASTKSRNELYAENIVLLRRFYDGLAVVKPTHQ
jgi:hypothetical protein